MRSPEVDAFLAEVPQPHRSALERLREDIHRAAPGAGERIAYRIPVITYEGANLVGFNAAKDHVSFQLMSTAAVDSNADALRGYSVGRGSVQFGPEAPLPAELVARLVASRIAENQAVKAAREARRRKEASG